MDTNTILAVKASVKAEVVYLITDNQWAAMTRTGECLGTWPGLPAGWRAAALAVLRHTNLAIYEATLSAVFDQLTNADAVIRAALAKIDDGSVEAMWHDIEQHLEADRQLKPRYYFVVATKKYGRNQTSSGAGDPVLWYYQNGERHEPKKGTMTFVDFLAYLDENDLVLAPGNEGMEVRENMVVRRYIKRGA
ncbi:MAG: hypothetical protein FOGNACKC_00717 [Anaerolineae bacterium]|nr:hypothetical protein [Anaerolineae bacterium]